MSDTPRQTSASTLKALSPWLLGALTVVSTFWGFYSHFANRQLSSFAYTIPQPFKIFDSSTPSRISVLGANGEQIENDVYLQEIIIWNNGNQSIEPNVVRVPITLGIAPLALQDSSVKNAKNQILEFKVARQTDPNISKVRARQESNKIGDPRIRLEWDHLDAGQGARVQIIYSTSSETALNFDVRGQIAGISRLTNGNTSILERAIPWIPSWLVLLTIFLVFIMGAAVLVKRNIQEDSPTPFWVLLVYMLFFSVLFTYLWSIPLNAPITPQFQSVPEYIIL